MRRPEQALQRTIIAGLRAALPQTWLVAHVPNGGKRSAVEGAIFKAMGVLPGVPDILVLGETDHGATAWFFEVKADRGSLTPAQRQMHEKLRDLGFGVAVVKSWDDVVTTAALWKLPLRIAA
jgi:hypothetical protein